MKLAATKSLGSGSVWMLALSLGCSNPPSIELPTDTSRSAAREHDSGADARIAVCDGAPQGTACGQPGDRMHCVFDACVRNACGDGWPADTEECDDGNETDGDGCSSRCRMELPPGCGNGVLEPGEECDDGDAVSGDRCESDCTIPTVVSSAGAGATGAAGDDGLGTAGTGAAGTGIAGTGAAGTGTAGTGTAGTGAAGTGTAGTGTAGTGVAGTGGVDESCEACRQLNCTNYLDFINPVAGCFDAGAAGVDARGAFGATFTMTQIQACVDAASCAHEKHCGFQPSRPASECYCGAAYPNNGDCAAAAAGTQNGVCKAEFEAAAESTVPSVVMANMASTDYPSGWVFYLLDCETTYCNGGADGDCTP